MAIRFCRLFLKLLSISLLSALDVFLLLLPISFNLCFVHIPSWSISFYLSLATCVLLVCVSHCVCFLSSHSFVEHFVLSIFCNLCSLGLCIPLRLACVIVDVNGIILILFTGPALWPYLSITLVLSFVESLGCFATS